MYIISSITPKLSDKTIFPHVSQIQIPVATVTVTKYEHNTQSVMWYIKCLNLDNGLVISEKKLNLYK